MPERPALESLSTLRQPSQPPTQSWNPMRIIFAVYRDLEIEKLEGNGPKDERAAMMVVSEANFDLRFEFSNLNYPGTCVHVVSNSRLGGL